MRKKELRNIFVRVFDFLWNDYDFVIKNDKKENWGYTLEAINRTTGIRVVYEYREAFINVILYELIDGEIIENTTQAILKNEKINGFSLDAIVSLINPNDLRKPFYPLEANVDRENDLANYASQVAKNLCKYGKDVLSGNFAIFKQLDPIVKKQYWNYYKNK